MRACVQCGKPHRRRVALICDACTLANQLGLRPIPPAGCTSMTTRKRYPVFPFVLIGALLAVGIILALAALLTPDDAEAHAPQPIACQYAWQLAPAGEKWTAKQRCIAAQRRHVCITHTRPVPGYVTVKGLRLLPGRDKRNSPHWKNQRHVIGWIVNEGLRRDLSYTVVLSAIAATTQEATARELDYGHDTSVGPFQLISSHGPEHLRITVEFSGTWYFNGALKELRRLGPMSAADLAQEVEESAHPDLYELWIPEARRTLAAVLGPCRLK